MRNIGTVLSCVLFCAVSGCASINGGTTQEITVVTTPADARCVFEREGLPIGAIERTPGTLLVRRLKEDIEITCSKDGYQEAHYLNNSGLSNMVAANVATDILLTAGLSSIIDSASGADNEYESAVNMSLAPVVAGN